MPLQENWIHHLSTYLTADLFGWMCGFHVFFQQCIVSGLFTTDLARNCLFPMFIQFVIFQVHQTLEKLTALVAGYKGILIAVATSNMIVQVPFMPCLKATNIAHVDTDKAFLSLLFNVDCKHFKIIEFSHTIFTDFVG